MKKYRSWQERQQGREKASLFLRWLLPWLAVGVAAALIFNSLFLLQGLLLASLPSKDVGVWQHWLTSLGLLLGAVFCFACMRPTWPLLLDKSKRDSVHIAQHWFPFWVGLAFLMMSATEGIKIYLSWISPSGYVPYWTNSLELVRYPCLLLAILCLPGRPLSSNARLRLVVDGFLIITALITFSWYFLLGPLLLFHGYTTLLDKLVGVAYPFGDLLLCYCLLRLAVASHKQIFQPTRWLLLFGLTSLIVSGSIAAYEVVHATHSLITWTTLCDSAGYLLIALAVQALRPAASHIQGQALPAEELHTHPPEPGTDTSLWQALLPLLFVPAVGGLLFFVWHTGVSSLPAEGVYLGSVLISTLLLSRQALFIQETHIYNTLLYRMQRELHDKNDRLEAQAKEVTRAYEQQRQVNELKDQLLLNVNHELRTPLTEMNGYLEMLEVYHEQIDAEARRRFIEHALHGSRELQRLVNTVLDALQSTDAQISLHLEEVALVEVVQRAVDLFGPRKWQDYQLQITLPEHLQVRADRQYVYQVLCNLLSNAVKYSPAQTVIEIGASACAPTSQGQEVCIWVKDGGPGIASTDIPLLFEKFVRLKRDQMSTIRGTGLGLYICKQLVSAMGGRIWVESTGVAGQGSRFCFTLPYTHQ